MRHNFKLGQLGQLEIFLTVFTQFVNCVYDFEKKLYTRELLEITVLDVEELPQAWYGLDPDTLDCPVCREPL